MNLDIYKKTPNIAKNFISELRKSDIQNFYSNYFLNELNEKIQFLQNENSIIILQPDKDVHRLYFAYTEIASFEKLLKQLPQDIKICLEIITKNEIDTDLYNRINKYLSYETTFVRSRCNIKDLRILSSKTEHIEFATLSDLILIEENLNKTFNHFSSHLPTTEELKEYILNKQILITKLQNKIDSFILYKINQNNINFDQWVSLSKDAKNGMKIIDTFYAYIKSLNYKQIYNWVDIEQNKAVLNFHRFYGFKPDGTKDIYFINKTLRESKL